MAGGRRKERKLVWRDKWPAGAWREAAWQESVRTLHVVTCCNVSNQ